MRIGNRILSIQFCLIFLTACAGPATPFGAIWDDELKEERKSWQLLEMMAKKDTKFSELAKMEFYPKRQLLHNRSNFVIYVHDPNGIPEDYNLKLKYDNHDVSYSFLQQADIQLLDGDRYLRIEIPRLNLSPTKDHNIEVLYQRSATSKVLSKKYLAPECSFYGRDKIVSTEQFKVDPDLLNSIQAVAEENGINPTFLAALIAQESGFKSTAVSWAKAIGLTQVTPIAETTVSEHFPLWPRYPKINRKSSRWLRYAIKHGKVNESNEWRLNPLMSIQGGITYLTYLEAYWNKIRNREVVENIYTNAEREFPRLVLASYNSGAARVKSALKNRNESWLAARKLREANKYVRKIYSFCYHFSQAKEEDNERTTTSI